MLGVPAVCISMHIVLDRTRLITPEILKLRSGDDVEVIESALAHPSGLQCCMGQFLSQCGLPKDTLVGNFYPSAVPAVYSLPEDDRWAALISGKNYDWGSTLGILENKLAQINDGRARYADLCTFERESALAEAFAEAGHTVEFTGDYAEGLRKALAYLA
jgi:hypothetical protein